MPAASAPKTPPTQGARFPPQAFAFLRDALEHTSVKVHGPEPDEAPRENRHVTGAQLCVGFRELAVAQFGRLAPVVMAHWRITRTEDIGAIVFALIDAGLLRKTEEDRIEDFQGVYDFAEAFGEYAIG